MMTRGAHRAGVIALGLAIGSLGLSVWLASSPRHALSSEAAARVADIPVIAVAEMERALAFYSRVLRFERVSDVEVIGGEVDGIAGGLMPRTRVARIRLGTELIELVESIAPAGDGVAPDRPDGKPSSPSLTIVVNDVEQAYLWVRRHRVEPVSALRGPDTDSSPEEGVVRAFSIRDPDGHRLDVVEFPAGEVEVRWQRATDSVFLGILRPLPAG